MNISFFLNIAGEITPAMASIAIMPKTNMAIFFIVKKVEKMKKKSFKFMAFRMEKLLSKY